MVSPKNLLVTGVLMGASSSLSPLIKATSSGSQTMLLGEVQGMFPKNKSDISKVCLRAGELISKEGNKWRLKLEYWYKRENGTCESDTGKGYYSLEFDDLDRGSVISRLGWEGQASSNNFDQCINSRQKLEEVDFDRDFTRCWSNARSWWKEVTKNNRQIWNVGKSRKESV